MRETEGTAETRTGKGGLDGDAGGQSFDMSRWDTMRAGGASMVGLAVGGAGTSGATGISWEHESVDTNWNLFEDDGPIADFAHWAAELTLADVPNDVIEKTEWQIGNQIAAAVAGRKHGSPDVPTDGDAATIVGGETGSVPDALFANATYGMRNDYDSYKFMGHPCHGTVFPALALAEERGLTAAEYVENVIVANELSGRLSGSLVIGPNNGQLVASIHAVAAAVIAARIDGDREAIDNAFRLALYSPVNPNWAGLFHGHGKDFTAAMPATTGIRLGEMAAVGARGASRALESFHDTETFIPFPEFLDGWGESWTTRSLGYKPAPADAYGISAIEAYQQVMDEEGLDIEDVEQITVEGPILLRVLDNLAKEWTPSDRLEPIAVNYNIKNALGVHAVEGELSTEVLAQDNLDAIEDDVREVAEMIEVEHDWGHTVDMIDGIGKGMDVTPLLEDRGLKQVLMSLGDIWDAYGPIDTGSEAKNLLESPEAIELLEAGGQLGWSEFDMAAADFDEVDLSFGATVRVYTDTGGWFWGETSYERSLPDHAGASARDDAEKRAVVAEKFERHLGPHFDVVDGLHQRDLEELTAIL